MPTLFGDQPAIPMPGTTYLPKQSQKALIFTLEGLVKKGGLLATGSGVTDEGTAVGYDTVAQKFVRAYKSHATAASAAAATTVTLADVTNLLVNDKLAIGANPVLTVTAINAGTKVVTLSAGLTNAVNANDIIKKANGADVLVGFTMLGVDATSQDRFINIGIGGWFILADLVGLNTDMYADVFGRVVPPYGVFRF